MNPEGERAFVDFKYEQLDGLCFCCKIDEAQITKIDYENILGLRKISKQTIGTKKINPKENRHKTPRITWFDNNLHPRIMTNKFHYNKFEIIQIDVDAFSHIQILNLQCTKRKQITKP